MESAAVVPNRLFLIREADFSRTVVELAQLHHWRVYHTWLSAHSAKGFPDLVLLRGSRHVVAELKRENGKLTDAQREWLDAFRLVGAEVHCWRPSSWATIEAVLGRREAP